MHYSKKKKKEEKKGKIYKGKRFFQKLLFIQPLHYGQNAIQGQFLIGVLAV